MSNFIKVKLNQVADNFDNIRVPLSAKQRANLERIYPYYGAQSIIDHVDNYLFDGEYILVAEDGENLKSQESYVCNLVKGKFWVNNHAHIIKAKEGYNTKYLFYYLNLIDFKPFITGSAQPKLTKDNLNSIPLIIHDKIFQKPIAKVLSDIDAKIEVNNQINQELEAMSKTLYEYWFVQFDFPNEQGKPYKSSGSKMVYSQELKREIPEGWEVRPLAKITSISNDSINPMLSPDKEFKHYSIPVLDATNTYGLEKGDDIRSNKFTVSEADILVSKLNPWFSRVVYATNEPGLICSTEFVVWRTSDSNIKNYLYVLARGEHFITHCTQSATGTSNSHKRVNPKVMMRYKVAFQSELIQKFGKIIDPWIKLSINKQRENKELIILRDWLLPMLMNGQVRVGEVEEELNIAAEPRSKYNKN
jgi:type I restriction enzyme S subunit